MSMRYERMGDTQELARRKSGQITEVEQKGAPAKSEIDEQPWIGKRLIDETGLNKPSHAARTVRAWPRAETNMISAHSSRREPFPALSDRTMMPDNRE
jgi:hypothetical protein